MEVGASLCLRCQRACDGTHSFNLKNRPDKIWNFNRPDLALAIDSNFFRKKKITRECAGKEPIITNLLLTD